MPTVCSESCVGRIRYLGVLLYDADAIENAASTENEKDLYQRQLDVFLDPNDPKVIEQALKDGIPQSVIDAAQQSPVYKMAMDWKLALPLHGIPHPADGLVRAASVSDSVCGGRGRAGQQRYSAGRGKPAYPGSVPPTC